jgi:hypothetical protein
MLVNQIRGKDVPYPFNRFDSLLELPNGKNPNQNAWLTLQLRVKLNFVDRTNPLPDRTLQEAGQWYGLDYSTWKFPILDWPDFYKLKFAKGFQARAEKTWNWQFVLKTPRTIADLDITNDDAGGWLLRPNVLCLFRIWVDAAGTTIPALTRDAPTDITHTINVVNLDLRTTSVSIKDASKLRPGQTSPKRVSSPMDAGTWRSDSGDMDDRDLFAPYFFDSRKGVLHDTVSHEIGHVLGQAHILGLLGLGDYALDGAKFDAPESYGRTWEEKANVMGSGDRVYLVNALSWRERIVRHLTTPTTAADWEATGNMTSFPPRKMALGASLVGGTLVF